MYGGVMFISKFICHQAETKGKVRINSNNNNSNITKYNQKCNALISLCTSAQEAQSYLLLKN